MREKKKKQLKSNSYGYSERISKFSTENTHEMIYALKNTNSFGTASVEQKLMAKCTNEKFRSNIGTHYLMLSNT